MKLLFCIKAMNNPGGGAERVLAEVVNGLVERGHQVSLLTFEAAGGQSFYPLHPAVTRIGLAVGSTTAPATLLWTLQRIRALRRAVRQLQPDVAVGFMHSMFIPLGLALVQTGIPVIASEHTVPDHYRGRPLQALLLSLVPLLIDRMTCVSEQAKRSYPPALRKLIAVVPNPVVVDGKRRADVAPAGLGPNTLLTVGRLTPEKDHATLIRAFASIADDVPGWQLRIVGDGELRHSLDALVHDLGLDSRVERPGAVAGIEEEYLRAQLFVVPSRYESFGLATAEALAHGLPAVGFADCPGTNELIVDGFNGRLVAADPERTTALAAVLKHLMLDADERRR